MIPSTETLKSVLLLKILRVVLHWPQSKMADELGISQSALARLERCDANVSVDILSKIIKLAKQNDLHCDIFSETDFTVVVPDSLLERQVVDSDNRSRTKKNQ